MFGAGEDSARLSGPSPSLQAVKQAAWQPCLPRQVNKMEQSPGATAGEHYHFEGSQKNWHILGNNSQKEAINYPLSLATAAEIVNLTIWKTGIVSKEGIFPPTWFNESSAIIIFCATLFIHSSQFFFPSPSLSLSHMYDEATFSSVKPQGGVGQHSPYQHMWAAQRLLLQTCGVMNKSCRIKPRGEKFLSWGPTFT